MKTIILQEPEKFARADAPEPGPPGQGEVLVRVRRVGVCGTDLHAFRGRQPFFTYPRILGHELGVEVEAVGEGVEGLESGVCAAIEPYLHCGRCQACRRGCSNCCEKLQVLGVHIDGGMRERLRVPAAKVHVSAKLDLDQLALVETLGIGAHAVERARLQEGEGVLVIGAGPIGLSVIQFAHLAGTKPVLLERSAHRRAFCRKHFGVKHCLEGGENVGAQIREVLEGQWPTAVFDATGNLRSMEASFGFVAHTGRLVLVGFQLEPISFQNPEFHRRELTLLASRNARAEDFVRIVRLIEEGQIDTRPWITHRAGSDRVIKEFPRWLDPERQVIKAMVEW